MKAWNNPTLQVWMKTGSFRLRPFDRWESAVRQPGTDRKELARQLHGEALGLRESLAA
jgi:hypothetical protein